MKTITLSEAANQLFGYTSTAEALKLLQKHKITPAMERVGKRNTYRFYDQAAIEALAQKLRPQKPAAPVENGPGIEDNDILPYLKKIDGVSSYLCSIGDRVQRLESVNRELAARNRELVIGMNRLLGAAKLQQVALP